MANIFGGNSLYTLQLAARVLFLLLFSAKVKFVYGLIFFAENYIGAQVSTSQDKYDKVVQFCNFIQFLEMM